MNFYYDSAEWSYLLKNAVDWDTIIPLFYPSFPTEEGFKNKEEILAYYEEILANTGEWTGNEVARRARDLDIQGPGKVIDGHVELSESLKELYQEARHLEIFGMGVSKQYGGQGLPLLVALITFSQLNRACISSATQIGFFTTILDMLERFCDKETRDKFIPMVMNGEISGSMCLTEPGAGSDVGALRTSAQKLEDGTYLLNGSKIFITNGGGGLGFVLARINGSPEGLGGISLFFAEEWLKGKENYRITKIEEKLGLHGSMTCEVVYENSRAILIGQVNEGFKIMLHLMNVARIGVGMQSLGGMEACLHYLRSYAENRTQFKRPLTELPLYKRNLSDYETERDAFRALMVDTLSHYEIYQFLDSKERHTGDLTEKERKLFKEAKRAVRQRTPIVKAYGAETFTLLSQRAIQGLGGYGFMKEYDAERFHRDSFATLLYEGTTQIQALMSMKDLLKLVMDNPQRYFKVLFYTQPLGSLFQGSNEVEKKMFEMKYNFKKNLGKLLLKCLRPQLGNEHGIQDIFKLKSWQRPEGIEILMGHAETLHQALSYMETLKVLSKHAKKDSSRNDLFNRYLQLVKPRLAGIYTDWKVR